MAAGADGRERLTSNCMAGDRARVFFALWPDESVREALVQVAVAARAECGGRVVARDKIHLTLCFVGLIERARLTVLEALAASVQASDFVLDVDTLGYWRHNSIVWAGARVCPDALAALAADLREALAREGVLGEERPYVPHVTLVRNARRAPVSALAPSAAWDARDFVLVESVPAGGGVRYEVRGRWPLRAL